MSTRDTIDFGIDLGTTNSAVALLVGVSAEIIKNNDSIDITPSAVTLSRTGAVHVGQRAKNRLVEHPEDSCVEFKRRMGTAHEYIFRASNRALSPEELSAEVLKQLRQDVQARTQEEMQAAVITVPAAFELHQCDATRRAAELAGLRGSPLLQEPVAAALAHGFQVESEKSYWLIYDFGGGTFDAALIKADEGMIHVVNHGGDNFLGGSDIDWALLEKVVAPKLAAELGLADFTRANSGRGQAWRQAFAKLKHAVEAAKIELSRKPSVVLEGARLLNEATGEEAVESWECELTQRDLIAVAEPIVRRSIDICTRVLQEKNLPAGAVEKTILVGGPTLAPYFRSILEEGLGIPLEPRLDPLTVVARGAAIFAGTQKMPRAMRKRTAPGEYTIELKYKAVSHESDPLIGGKVLSAEGAEFAGFSIELVNPRTLWRSGKLALNRSGAFMLNVLAEKGERNVFTIELFDASGQRQRTNPDQFSYTIGATLDEQPLINSMGIALGNGEVAWFFEKGAGLPLKHKYRVPFRTTRALTSGSSETALVIPIVEGQNERAERNRWVGELRVRPENIKRDLPVGSEVEVTLKMSESRTLTITAYVPLLDEEFEGQVDLTKKARRPGGLESDCRAELHRIGELRIQALAAGDDTWLRRLNEIESSHLLAEMQEAAAAAQADPDAAEKCEKRLLELQLQLDDVEAGLKWPGLLREAEELLRNLRTTVSQHGTRVQKSRAATLERETRELMSARHADRLERAMKQANSAWLEVLITVPAFWVDQFRRLQHQKREMSDPVRAERLFEMGQRYLAEDNAQALRTIVTQLWSLLPSELMQAAQRGFQSTLLL